MTLSHFWTPDRATTRLGEMAGAHGPRRADRVAGDLVQARPRTVGSPWDKGRPAIPCAATAWPARRGESSATSKRPKDARAILPCRSPAHPHRSTRQVEGGKQ